jgi:hypothetical protein
VGVAIAFTVLAIVISLNWPYRYRNVKPVLQNVFAAQVEVHDYHRTYFPRPGFVAHGLIFRRKSNDPSLPALGTAETVIAQGGWLDLLFMRRHVEDVDLEGLHIVLPATGSKQRKEDFPAGSSADFSGPDTSIGKLSLRDSVLELQRESGPPLIFNVQKVIVRDLAKNKPVRYTLDMTNPMPTGHVLAHGSFGPIDVHDLGNTPTEGDYTFDDVRLSDIGALRGTLKARGHFDKTLASIAADSTAETDNFSVADGRPERVSARVECTINGLKGDIVLNSIDMKLAGTPVTVRGAITGDPKTARIDITVAHGRTQDLLQPFLHGRSPIAGAVSLHTHAEILPGKHQDFLSRLRMSGSFDVPADQLTNKATESQLSAFSERAQGGRENASEAQNVDALSELNGPFSVRDGIVSTERLHFAVAGATTDLHGTFSLRNQQVHLTGNLAMDSDISHATTGPKSDLLKVFAPFFKRKDKGAVVPIAVTGGPGSYRVQGNLLHTK